MARDLLSVSGNPMRLLFTSLIFILALAGCDQSIKVIPVESKEAQQRAYRDPRDTGAVRTSATARKRKLNNTGEPVPCETDSNAAPCA